MSQEEDIEKLDREIDGTALAIQTKVAEQVVQVLADLRKHPHRVGLAHAKILALALKIEQDRTAEAVTLGQKMAEAQRAHAIKVFDDILEHPCGDGKETHATLNRATARAYFLEKLGVK